MNAANNDEMSSHRLTQREWHWATRSGRRIVSVEGDRILGIVVLPNGNRHYADRVLGSMPYRYEAPMDTEITA